MRRAGAHWNRRGTASNPARPPRILGGARKGRKGRALAGAVKAEFRCWGSKGCRSLACSKQVRGEPLHLRTGALVRIDPSGTAASQLAGVRRRIGRPVACTQLTSVSRARRVVGGEARIANAGRHTRGEVP